MPGKILVVDDEPMVTEVVERYLRLNGYDVMTAGDGRDGLDRARTWRPDLVILDIMLPGMDGIEVCRQIREREALPVILLTAKGEEFDKILGLEMGADDYVVKPFSPGELVARVHSVLRRSRDGHAPSRTDTLRFGDLEILPGSREVRRDGAALDLTATEFDLLCFLAMHPERVYSREDLLNEVWGPNYAGEYGTVTVHIRRLRARIELDPTKPRYIKTVWGVGYKFTGGTDGV